MSSSIPNLNPARIRHFVLRIPVCTRLILVAIILLWITGISSGVRHWASLYPDLVFPGGAHRLTTYAFMHVGLIHLIVNLAIITPLLDRFESEYGTLTTFALFTGPFTTAPAVLYTLVSIFVFRTNTPIVGASTWSFLLATSQLTAQSRAQPYINAFGQRIPTLALPLLAIVITHFLVPHTSILAHLFGVAMGWLWGVGYIKFLIPPEKALRWVERKGKLLERIPYYVSVDQKTFGRYGVLPTSLGNAEMGNPRRSFSVS